MANAEHDGNFVPSLLGVSSADGVTVVPIYANPTTHRLLVDSGGGGSGITSINGDTTALQTLSTGTTGTDFTISDNGIGTHTFQIPTASASARGLLSSTDWSTFNSKGAGTVTAVSVASANGFSGTVSNPTTTPAISVSIVATGVLKGNGTAIGAATAGTDYTTPTGTEGLSHKNFTATTAQDQGNFYIVNSGDSTQKLDWLISTGFNNTATWTIPNISGTPLIDTGTQTTSNKRITKRTVTVTQSATPTINTDNTDVAYITGLAQAITSFTTNLSGTPNPNDLLWISITDNGTARAITWGASFESSTVTLPSTTVLSTRLDVLFCWNVATSKWRCLSSV